VLRVSGKVDGVRLPKEIFYTTRVMQNEQPDIHIIGHWNYAAGTNKDVVCRGEPLRPGGAVPQRKIIGVTTRFINLWTITPAAEAWAPRSWHLALTPVVSMRSPMSRSRPARSGGRTAGRKGRRAAGTADGGRTERHQAHAAHGAEGIARGRQRRGAGGFRGRGRAGPALPDGPRPRVDFEISRARASGAADFNAAETQIRPTTVFWTPSAASTAWPSARR